MKKLLVWQFGIMQAACHLRVKTSPVLLFVIIYLLFQRVKKFQTDTCKPSIGHGAPPV